MSREQASCPKVLVWWNYHFVIGMNPCVWTVVHVGDSLARETVFLKCYFQGTLQLKQKFATSWWAFLSAEQSEQLLGFLRFKAQERAVECHNRKGGFQGKPSRVLPHVNLPWLPTRLVSLLSLAIGNRCKSSLIAKEQKSQWLLKLRVLVISARV